MARVKLFTSEGTLSGSITRNTICMVEEPMLWAISMMLGSSSRSEDSTNRATKGKAATTRGTMMATEPVAVPTRARVSGMTTTISIRKGTERRKLMMTFSAFISGLGSGRMPFSSPVTRITPRGRPMRMANSVDSSVMYSVTHSSWGKSRTTISQASDSFSGVNAFKNGFIPPPPLPRIPPRPGP